MSNLYISLEVGIMSKQISLENDPRIIKSINALRGLGLKVHLEKVTDDWLYVAIDQNSIINTVKKLMERNIRWTQYLIMKEPETGFLVVHFWRGDMPSQLRMKLKI
jgi:hypothetical protein